MLSLVIRIAFTRRFNEYTQFTFHDKIFPEHFPKTSLNISFLELSEEFPWDLKTSSNQPSKRTIGVGVIELLLYLVDKSEVTNGDG